MNTSQLDFGVHEYDCADCEVVKKQVIYDVVAAFFVYDVLAVITLGVIKPPFAVLIALVLLIAGELFFLV